MHYVYGLTDPRTKELRYIGQTKQPDIRLRQHLNNVVGRTKKINWVKSLRKLSLVPELVILDVSPSTDIDETEREYIEYFRFIGARLTNMAPGGERGDVEASVRARKGKALSEKHRKLLSSRLIGKRKKKTEAVVRAHENMKHKISVRNVTTGEIFHFSSQTECASHTGMSRSNVYRLVRNIFSPRHPWRLLNSIEHVD